MADKDTLFKVKLDDKNVIDLDQETEDESQPNHKIKGHTKNNKQAKQTDDFDLID